MRLSSTTSLRITAVKGHHGFFARGEELEVEAAEDGVVTHGGHRGEEKDATRRSAASPDAARALACL
jgi:hypothetical protein